jgi:hypothetical protein
VRAALTRARIYLTARRMAGWNAAASVREALNPLRNGLIPEPLKEREAIHHPGLPSWLNLCCHE